MPEDETGKDGPASKLPIGSEKRFVQRTIQSLTRWAPLGGTSWAFASFLLRQEWAMAALLFPVTAVSGVWAAYSKNFIERLSEIYAERARNDAEGLVKRLDHWNNSIQEALKWQLSGFEEKYLKCQSLACQDDEPEGVENSITPLLQEVFVPLRLTGDCVLAGYSEKLSRPEEIVLGIWEVLKQSRDRPAYQQIVIRAWGGYGKTTLLKHLAYTYGKQQHRQYRAPKFIPFLLYLPRCWKQLVQETPPSLSELLLHYHLPTLPQAQKLQVPPHWAANLLEQGKALVMFDGFDEVPPAERSAVSEWLSQQMHPYRGSGSVFILTSRPAAYDNGYTARQTGASFWIDDFNQEQRQQFVEKWYLCQERNARPGRNTPDIAQKALQKANSLLQQIDERPELREIAGNVLLLSMMARFHREKQGDALPERKVELYQDICELQLSRRPRAKKISLLLTSLTQRQEVLQAVALEMMKRTGEEEQGFKQIPRNDLLGLIATAIARHDPEADPELFLTQAVQVSELLVEREGGIYEFSHLSFQEFLAASEIARLKQESILYDYLTVDTWRATILFYADLVSPIPLIEAAIARQAIPLAYRLWWGATRKANLSNKSKQSLQELEQTLFELRYQQLEDYLRNGQWQEADYETYRLMITTVGKEKGDFFSKEELLNFPCRDLKAIDDLWVKYSNGKFGFTVQKQIYVNCGATLDGNYPGKEVWEEFGNQVGWRMDNKWQAYRNFNFSTTALPGHLPLCGVLMRGGWGRKMGVSYSLASRLVNCNL